MVNYKLSFLLIHIYIFSLLSLQLKLRSPNKSAKCPSRSWSQRGTEVNRSHHGDNPLLRPTWIKIATKSLPGTTNREHWKLIGVKTLSLVTNYGFYCLECCQFFTITTLNYKLQRRLSGVLPLQRSVPENDARNF